MGQTLKTLKTLKNYSLIRALRPILRQRRPLPADRWFIYGNPYLGRSNFSQYYHDRVDDEIIKELLEREELHVNVANQSNSIIFYAFNSTKGKLN